MPEIIKNDGNNKSTNRLDMKQSDHLWIFASLELLQDALQSGNMM